LQPPEKGEPDEGGIQLSGWAEDKAYRGFSKGFQGVGLGTDLWNPKLCDSE